MIGDVPDKCPVCAAAREAYRDLRLRAVRSGAGRASPSRGAPPTRVDSGRAVAGLSPGAGRHSEPFCAEVSRRGQQLRRGARGAQFDLTAHDGSRVTLKQYRGDWFAVIVFLGADAAAAAAVTALSGVADELWGLRGQLVGIVAGDEQATARRRRPGRARRLSPARRPRRRRRARLRSLRRRGGRVRPYAVIVDRSGKIVWTADASPAAVGAGRDSSPASTASRASSLDFPHSLVRTPPAAGTIGS